LQDNITRYESSVGRIEVHGAQNPADGIDDGHLTIGFTQGEA
jgi:hypothetical protein